MKLFVMMLATFQTLMAAGVFLILYVLPDVSLGRAALKNADVEYLALLLLSAVVSGALTMRDMVRRSSEPFARATMIASLISGALAVVDVLVVLLVSNSGPAHLFWLDGLVILTAIAYVLHGRQARAKDGRLS